LGSAANILILAYMCLVWKEEFRLPLSPKDDSPRRIFQMATIEWKAVIRVRVGELTRTGQFDLWRAVQDSGLLDLSQQEQVLNWTRGGDELVAAQATRSVEVCEDGVWRALRGESATVLVDDEPVTVGFPFTPALFGDLPKSLANPWIRAALDVNGGLHDALFFVSSLVTITNNGSETPPADASSPPN